VIVFGSVAEQKITIIVPFVYMARDGNDFDGGDIHNEGHWKGWALKWHSLRSLPFLGQENLPSPSPSLAVCTEPLEINSDMKSAQDTP
jgi:hypothetical protein